MGWSAFVLALIGFFLSHSVPIRPPLRPLLERVLGRRGFTIAYSLLSVGALVWLIVAAGRAPFVLIWEWAEWQRYLALVLMLLSCLVFSMSLAAPNPFSFGGRRNDAFDPANPGFVRVTRHPLLLAVGFWALAHLIVNGDLAHVIVFGILLAFALLGGRLIDRRKKRELGQSWDTMTEAMQKATLASALPRGASGWGRLFAGGALYAALVALHPLVIGVNPLP